MQASLRIAEKTQSISHLARPQHHMSAIRSEKNQASRSVRDANPLLQLQRQLGNRNMQRLLSDTSRRRPEIVEHVPASQLSLYAIKAVGGKQYRVSDDENMAVRQDTNLVGRRTYYGSKYLYSEQALIQSSSTVLQTQGSALVLSKAGGPSLTVRAARPSVGVSSARFVGNGRLEAIMRGRRYQFIRRGSRGPAIAKIQQALVDAGFALPLHGVTGRVNSETVTAVKGFQSAKGLTGRDIDGIVGPITLGLLDKQFGGGPKPAVMAKILRPAKPKNIITATEGANMEIVDDCGGCAKTIMTGGKPGFSTAAPEGETVKGIYLEKGVEKETPVFVTSAEVRDYILMKATGKGDPASAKAAYWAKSAIERDLVDKNFGMNQYANIRTGESHSIVRGDNVGWNWHWGAVVMRSGNDLVTLENFAGSGSTAWDFQIYGLTGSQSFHAEQERRLQPDLVTPEYGYKPITVRIRRA